MELLKISPPMWCPWRRSSNPIRMWLWEPHKWNYWVLTVSFQVGILALSRPICINVSYVPSRMRRVFNCSWQESSSHTHHDYSMHPNPYHWSWLIVPTWGRLACSHWTHLFDPNEPIWVERASPLEIRYFPKRNPIHDDRINLVWHPSRCVARTSTYLPWIVSWLPGWRCSWRGWWLHGPIFVTWNRMRPKYLTISWIS